MFSMKYKSIAIIATVSSQSAKVSSYKNLCNLNKIINTIILLLLTTIRVFDKNIASDMASIPQAMHIVKMNRKMNKIDPSADKPSVMAGLDQPPKYASKMMNSIWGMYNRYSVHNIKSVQGDLVANASLSQTQPQYEQYPYHMGHDTSSAAALGAVGQAVAKNIYDNLCQN